LDAKDIIILSMLQENGRVPYSEMARKLGVSEAAVYTRVQKLVKRGYIKRFQAVLNEEKLGYGLLAFISIRAQPSKYNEVLRKLSGFDEIQEVHDVTGDYYCLLKVRTRSKDELAGLLDDIGRIDGIVSTETKVVLRTIKETQSLPIRKALKQY